MKRLALMAAGAVLLAAATHLLVVWATPRIVMNAAMAKIGGDDEINIIKNAPPATSKARTIVRPSPDLAYSACVLDLSKGSVRLRIPVTAPYTSLSLYSSATDNYFVLDDRNVAGTDMDVLVLGPDAERPAGISPEVTVVEAPAARGMAIVRRVIESKAALPAVDDIRARSVCAAYPG